MACGNSSTSLRLPRNYTKWSLKVIFKTVVRPSLSQMGNRQESTRLRVRVGTAPQPGLRSPQGQGALWIFRKHPGLGITWHDGLEHVRLHADCAQIALPTEG